MPGAVTPPAATLRSPSAATANSSSTRARSLAVVPVSFDTATYTIRLIASATTPPVMLPRAGMSSGNATVSTAAHAKPTIMPASAPLLLPNLKKMPRNSGTEICTTAW